MFIFLLKPILWVTYKGIFSGVFEEVHIIIIVVVVVCFAWKFEEEKKTKSFLMSLKRWNNYTNNDTLEVTVCSFYGIKTCLDKKIKHVYALRNSPNLGAYAIVSLNFFGPKFFSHKCSKIPIKKRKP